MDANPERDRRRKRNEQVMEGCPVTPFERDGLNGKQEKELLRGDLQSS